MSTTALGPILDLDGPLPVAPEYGLLTLPGVDKADTGDTSEGPEEAGGDIPELPDDRWQGGIQLYGFPVITPSLWDPCSAGTFRVKDEGGDEPIPRFDPIGIYLPITCSTLGYSPEMLNELQDRARRVLEATLSWAFETTLAQGVFNSNNAFLGDTNLVQLGGGAISAENAIAFLENAIGKTGRGGILHLTPAVAAKVGFNLLREEDPDGRQDSGDEYMETAAGTPVAIGGGYIGTNPTGKAASDTTVTGHNDWIFATGPVEIRRSEIVLDDPLRAVDRSDNTVTYRPELSAVVSWDTALQVGVLVDWSL